MKILFLILCCFTFLFSYKEKISYNSLEIKKEKSIFDFKCGQKKYCSQMKSCKEARFFLQICKLKRLDRDKDGIPCEKICGN